MKKKKTPIWEVRDDKLNFNIILQRIYNTTLFTVLTIGGVQVRIRRVYDYRKDN